MNDLSAVGRVDTACAVLAGSEVPLNREQACFYALFVELVQRHSGDRWAAERLADLVNSLQTAEAEGALATATVALRAGAWQAVAALCRRTGDRQQAVQCECAHHRARQALQAAWHEEQGLFAEAAEACDCSRWTNALVLYFALADPKQQMSVARLLADGSAAEDDLWQAFFVAGALWQAGADAAALAYVQRKWVRLLAHPGRTWGEKAGALAAQPGPESLLAAHVLGVVPKAEGILAIRPQLSGLERAEGVVPTPHGDVEVAWGAYGGGFSARLLVPHDGETHLAVPRCDKRFPQIEINGETVWRNEKAHPNFHVQELISEEERLVMVLRRAGQYKVLVE